MLLLIFSAAEFDRDRLRSTRSDSGSVINTASSSSEYPLGGTPAEYLSATGGQAEEGPRAVNYEITDYWIPIRRKGAVEDDRGAGAVPRVGRSGLDNGTAIILDGGMAATRRGSTSFLGLRSVLASTPGR